MADRRAFAPDILSGHDPRRGSSFYRTPEWAVGEPNPPDTQLVPRTVRPSTGTMPVSKREFEDRSYCAHKSSRLMVDD